MDIRIAHTPGSSLDDLLKIEQFSQGASRETPYKLVHDAFRRTAADYSSNIAVEHDGDQLTYGALDQASNNLSRKLLSLGLCPRDRVVLLVQRSIPMIVAIFAVLKSGCQYVPLDAGVASDDAVQHILSEVNPPFVLCLARYSQRAHQFASHETQVMCLEESWIPPADFDVESSHAICVDPEDGAYIIYTSGWSHLRLKSRLSSAYFSR